MERLMVSRRSDKQARAFLLDLARFGNHGEDLAGATEPDLQRFYGEKGLSLERIVNACRDPATQVPYLENLFRGVMVASEGASIARVNLQDGKETGGVHGPGFFAPLLYWPQFEQAADHFSKALAGPSYMDGHTCIALGIASLESYIAYRADIWNDQHPREPLVDSRDMKVKFDDKVTIWIPRMTGKIIDRSDLDWQDYRYLRDIRDRQVIHLSGTGVSISLADLAEMLDRFRAGIAHLLQRFHQAFGEPAPTRIIRLAHFPRIHIEDT